MKTDHTYSYVTSHSGTTCRASGGRGFEFHLGQYFSHVSAHFGTYIQNGIISLGFNREDNSNVAQPYFHQSVTSGLDESFVLSPVGDEIVAQELTKLNIKKATGPDDIPARFIQAASKYLAAPLTFVINLSIQQGKVPDLMKTARIKALYKKKSCRSSCNNYRLISILPIFVKILEKNCQLSNLAFYFHTLDNYTKPIRLPKQQRNLGCSSKFQQ